MIKKTKAGGLGERVAFRLSRPDYLTFLEKVQQSGKSKSDFFRQCVIDSNVTPKADDAETRAGRIRLLYLLNKAGNNINQLARAANSAHLSGKVDADLYRAILGHLEEISGEIKAAVRDANKN
jgi:hypothetical protein